MNDQIKSLEKEINYNQQTCEAIRCLIQSLKIKIKELGESAYMTEDPAMLTPEAYALWYAHDALGKRAAELILESESLQKSIDELS